MSELKKLPIGIQSFPDLRENGYIYVDKTEHIYRMIDSGKVYFLSRPRRFGKSLLISTLSELFQGNESLFQGLYIHDKWDWSKKNPVIRIDWSSLGHENREDIESSIMLYFEEIAKRENIEFLQKTAGNVFRELIEKLHFKYGQKVVILIDEYDKPILDHLTDDEQAEENRTSLKNFYQIIKGSDDHIRFVLLTGVTRFAGVSIFSGLNNLNDISLTEKYSTICGYTQEELFGNFIDYFPKISEKYHFTKDETINEIKNYYDGYSWDGENFVYNPFSTLLLFANGEFSNYWFRTGTPTFLLNIIKTKNVIEPIINPIEISGMTSFGAFDPLNIEPTDLLFQTGYLTIKTKEITGTETNYTLDIPNYEVRKSLTEQLIGYYSEQQPKNIDSLSKTMKKQLNAANAEGLTQSIRQMLAHIPYELHIPREAYYHSLFLLWFKLLGFEILGEISTNIGRIDAVLKTDKWIIITELKYSENGAPEKLLDEALHQIHEKRYAEMYAGKETMLLAIAVTEKDHVMCRIEL